MVSSSMVFWVYTPNSEPRAIMAARTRPFSIIRSRDARTVMTVPNVTRPPVVSRTAARVSSWTRARKPRRARRARMLADHLGRHPQKRVGQHEPQIGGRPRVDSEEHLAGGHGSDLPGRRPTENQDRQLGALRAHVVVIAIERVQRPCAHPGSGLTDHGDAIAERKEQQRPRG